MAVVGAGVVVGLVIIKYLQLRLQSCTLKGTNSLLENIKYIISLQSHEHKILKSDRSCSGNRNQKYLQLRFQSYILMATDSSLENAKYFPLLPDVESEQES